MVGCSPVESAPRQHLLNVIVRTRAEDTPSRIVAINVAAATDCPGCFVRQKATRQDPFSQLTHDAARSSDQFETPFGRARNRSEARRSGESLPLVSVPLDHWASFQRETT
jgi:hypothetical protein